MVPPASEGLLRAALNKPSPFAAHHWMMWDLFGMALIVGVPARRIPTEQCVRSHRSGPGRVLDHSRHACTAAPGARVEHGQQPHLHLRERAGRRPLLQAPVTALQEKDWLAEQAVGVTLTGGNGDAQHSRGRSRGSEMPRSIVLLNET